LNPNCALARNYIDLLGRTDDFIFWAQGGIAGVLFVTIVPIVTAWVAEATFLGHFNINRRV
tara:strand:- start:58 stop:240 length:183 start_codon:yes stop_codon:yes gene_type:complete